MRILYQFPDWLHCLYPNALWRVASDDASLTVYLTFDDGPVPEVTPQVLDILDSFGIKATFFWVGENLLKYPHLAQEVVQRGHRIGNHTYHHISGWSVSAEKYIDNILKAESIIGQTIQGYFGEHTKRLFRPPYGRMRREVYEWLKARGYTVVLWDLVTHDYNRRYTPEEIERICMRYVRDGSIILMHDSIKASENTLVVLPRLICRLQTEGYQFRML